MNSNLVLDSSQKYKEEYKDAVHRGLHNQVVLLKVGRITLVNFGLFAALGGAIASFLILARQFQAGMQPLRYATLLFVIVPALAIVGSRLYVLALEFREFRKAPFKTLFRPGFAFQGGLATAMLGTIGLAVAYDINPLLFMDTIVLGLPLGHALGRLGCFTYGCCHGKPTQSSLAVCYTNPDSKVTWGSGLSFEKLHPTQLYSAIGNLALFVLLNILAISVPLKAGQLTGLYGLLGASGRFLIEFLRGIPTLRFWGLTNFQFLSLGFVGVGALIWALASAGTPQIVFMSTKDWFEALIQSGQHLYYPLWVFGFIFVCLGIHGRRVGRFELK